MIRQIEVDNIQMKTSFENNQFYVILGYAQEFLKESNFQEHESFYKNIKLW